MVATSMKLSGGAGGALSYLCESESVREYYGREDATWEVWGKASERLGITNLTDAQFESLWNGEWEGRKLTRSGYRKGDDGTTVTHRTSAIDCLVSAPKSVAQLYTASDEATRRELDHAMRTAAREAFESLERYAKVTRRSWRVDGKLESERINAELIAVPVIQYAARRVDKDRLPDPSLHCHTVVFTLCHDGTSWKTADQFGILKQQYDRDNVFMNALAREIERLGFEIEYDDFANARKGKIAWEVAGHSTKLNRFWSQNNQRAWELRLAHEAKEGKPMSESELSHAMRSTRLAKTEAAKQQDRDPDWSLWEQEAARYGHHVPEFKRREPITHEDALLVLRERLYGANGLTKQDSIFTLDEVGPAVRRCAVGLGLELDQIEEFTRNVELVPVREAIDPTRSYYTTQQHLDAESRVLEALNADSSAAPLPRRSIYAASGKTELSYEQYKAVEALCANTGTMSLVGPAGTGKGRVLGVVSDAHRAEGHQVVVVSTAGATALRSGRDMRADRAGSVESVLRQIDQGTITPGPETVFIIDEAATMDTLRADALFARIDDSPVILVGDEKQLPAVGASGWFSHAPKTFELNEVHRQRRVEDRNLYGKLREGHTREVLAELESRGKLVVSDDRSMKIRDSMTVYSDLRTRADAEAVRFVVDTSNHDVDTLNRFVQADRVKRGEVDRRAAFEVIDREQNRRWSLHQGDHVTFLQHHYERGQVPVRNGTNGVLVGTRGNRAVVDTEDGRTVFIPVEHDAHRQTIGLAYAQHAQRYQGATVDHAIILPGHEQTSLNAGYSAATRSRETTHVVIDRETHGEDARENLAHDWRREVEKELAREHLRRQIEHDDIGW